jgi:alanine racemase
MNLINRVVAEINLISLRKNLQIIRNKAPGTRILAMVKGNAYGHGMVTIAKALMDVDYLGVACMEAALALRHAGVMQPIVLTSGFSTKEELDLILEHHIQPFIFGDHQIDLIEAAEKEWSKNNHKNNHKNKSKSKSEEKTKDPQDSQDPQDSHQNFSQEVGLDLWLKVNTGMNRLGFKPKDSVKAWQRLYLMQNQSPGNHALHENRGKFIKSIKWATHFACAYEEDLSDTLEQINLFTVLTEEMGELKSAANSAAILKYPESHFDIVRPGSMLYGVSPIKLCAEGYEKLYPVMTLKAKVIGLNLLEPGQAVGYGKEWTASKASKVAVVSIGYGDGYPQKAPEGTPVLVRGRMAPIIGRVSMDSLTVDVSKILGVKLNDEVILWGEDLPVELVASEMDCSPTVLLTGINHRVCRQVVDLE